MNGTQYDDEIKVEFIDEGTDYHGVSHTSDHFQWSLPKGYRLASPNNVYIIEKLLGHGSFGITYLAKCNGKKVAVKEFFMHQFCGRESSTYEVTGSSPGNQIEYYGNKFRLEAANLKKLKHDNIVRVFEAFEANKTYYYSMEYIDGESLNKYIKENGALNEEEAVDCMLAISDAIKYMHSKKMLHLDLKPSNVMRSSAGHYYVIDFGLSKQFNENGEPESSSNIGLGTPGYAPTEQVEHNGKTFAPWIDVYALGGVFFKMLTGNTPPTASEVLNNGLPIDELKSHGASKSSINLVKSMMEPICKKRIQDVETIINKLPLSPNRISVRQQQQSQPQATTPPVPSFLKKIVMVAAGVVILVVGGNLLFNSGVDGEELIEKTVADTLARQTTGQENGHEWVDLGLSVKWATMNIGIKIPLTLNKDYTPIIQECKTNYPWGGYYAWGETRTKEKYEWSNYFDSCDDKGNSFETYMLNGQTEIIPSGGHDAARENWGGTWRMPSEAEIEELCKKCKWQWCEHSLKGFLVTGPNGNSIFLPAVGNRLGSSGGIYGLGDTGYYWSSTLSSSDSDKACCLHFYNYHKKTIRYKTDYRDRSNGGCVRAVTE